MSAEKKKYPYFDYLMPVIKYGAPFYEKPNHLLKCEECGKAERENILAVKKEGLDHMLKYSKFVCKECFDKYYKGSDWEICGLDILDIF